MCECLKNLLDIQIKKHSRYGMPAVGTAKIDISVYVSKPMIAKKTYWGSDKILRLSRTLQHTGPPINYCPICGEKMKHDKTMVFSDIRGWNPIDYEPSKDEK